MSNRDAIILEKMIQYANEIAYTIQKFNLDYVKFAEDFIVKNAVSMCI